MYTMQQLNCFVEVARNLSFARAAENLFISQPAVSHHIRALEAELGCKLFERDRQRVSLTPAGNRFYLEVIDVIDQLDRATALLRGGTMLPEFINIGFENTIEIFKLPDILSEYTQAVPNIRINFHGVNLGEAIKMFNTNKLDVLFTTCRTINVPGEKFYQLFTGYFCCIVQEDDPLAQKECIRFPDLENRTMIFAEKKNCAPEMAALQRQLHLSVPSIKVHFSTSAHYSIPMVESGLGIILMPNFLLTPHRRTARKLVAVPLEPRKEVPFGIMVHKDVNSKRISEFLRITRKLYSPETGCEGIKKRKANRIEA